jgi:hypothetical protein
MEREREQQVGPPRPGRSSVSSSGSERRTPPAKCVRARECARVRACAFVHVRVLTCAVCARVRVRVRACVLVHDNQ